MKKDDINKYTTKLLNALKKNLRILSCKQNYTKELNSSK